MGLSFKELGSLMTSSLAQVEGVVQRTFKKPQRPRKAMDFEIVKSSPIPRLDDQYQGVTDESSVDDLFYRLRRKVFQCIDAANKVHQRSGTIGDERILRESGYMNKKRAYFYIQPLNDNGFLFERSGDGWVVSRAQKIVGGKTFMRDYDSWDHVRVFESKNGSGTMRVSSERFKDHLVSFVVYEQKLTKLFI